MTTRDRHDDDGWDDDSSMDEQLTEPNEDHGAALDAFDSYTLASEEDSNLDELDPFAGAERFIDDGDDLDALNALDVPAEAGGEGEAGEEALVTVANPPGTVTVTANLAGAVQRIELASAVTTSTELELASEIRAVADVASKRASAVMHVIGVELLTVQGVDHDTAANMISQYAPLASPAQASAAEANLAARHDWGV